MPETAPIAINANHLAKTFKTQAGELTLFNNLSLQVQQGESIAIIGQSGAGKSTLLSLLAGLDTPTSGNVQLSGVDLSTLEDSERAAWRAQHLGFIFQSFHLLPELNATENVQLPLHDHYPAQLSGGEQQRVAIARAFVTSPTILFADEPTGNLDAETGEKIIQQLFDLNARKSTTLVLITHDDHLASRCDRQFRLSNGQLVDVSRPQPDLLAEASPL